MLVKIPKRLPAMPILTNEKKSLMDFNWGLVTGSQIAVLVNVYPHDDLSQSPLDRWRTLAFLLFANRINYCVYQNITYDLNQFKQFASFGL